MKDSNKKTKELIIIISTVILPILIGSFAEDPAKTFTIISAIGIVIFTTLLILKYYPATESLMILLRVLFGGGLTLCTYNLIDKFLKINYLIKVVLDNEKMKYWWIQWYSVKLLIGATIVLSFLAYLWKYFQLSRYSDYAKLAIKGVTIYFLIITIIFLLNDIFLIIPEYGFSYIIKIDSIILLFLLIIALPLITHYMIYSYHSISEYKTRVKNLPGGKNGKI